LFHFQFADTLEQEPVFKGKSPQKRGPSTPSSPAAVVSERIEPTLGAEAVSPNEQEGKEEPPQKTEQAVASVESDASSRERSKSAGESTEYSSESSEPRRFRADLADENDREAVEEEPLVVHTSKPGKKKKKKPAEIN